MGGDLESFVSTGGGLLLLYDTFLQQTLVGKACIETSTESSISSCGLQRYAWSI